MEGRLVFVTKEQRDLLADLAKGIAPLGRLHEFGDLVSQWDSSIPASGPIEAIPGATVVEGTIEQGTAPEPMSSVIEHEDEAWVRARKAGVDIPPGSTVSMSTATQIVSVSPTGADSREGHRRIVFSCGHVKAQCKCLGPKRTTILPEACKGCEMQAGGVVLAVGDWPEAETIEHLGEEPS